MIGVSEEHRRKIFTRLSLNRKSVDSDGVGNIFVSFGLDLSLVRDKTFAVLLAGATDDPAQI
jgi:hypothetical protein